MTTRHITWLALGAGVLALVLSGAVAVQSGLKAWTLNQKIEIALQQKDKKNVQDALPQLYLVQAPSHGAAGATLLARLRASARKSGVSLQRAEPRPLDPADPQSVKISAQASGPTEAIAAFIYELEARPPALLIERARLNVGNNKTTVSVDILVAARAQYGRSAP
jgi:hypothetical protein